MRYIMIYIGIGYAKGFGNVEIVDNISLLALAYAIICE
jgi:hypothetical protein